MLKKKIATVIGVIVYFIVIAGALWGAIAPYSYFRNDELRNFLGIS